MLRDNGPPALVGLLVFDGVAVIVKHEPPAPKVLRSLRPLHSLRALPLPTRIVVCRLALADGIATIVAQVSNERINLARGKRKIIDVAQYGGLVPVDLAHPSHIVISAAF